MVKTIVRQAAHLQPMEVNGGADIHLQPMEDPMLEQVDSLKEAVTLWETHAGAGSWQDLWPHGERSPHWSRFAGRTCDPMGDPHWSSLLLKDCTPTEGTHVGAVCEELQPVGRTQVGETHEGPSPMGGTPRWSRGRV
ncbi:suppression of tumorigenicity 5 protein isoform x4 [Limosa lapponica baueri]|uniref:Suppression of tumorigenicity 5 protein isoform x4 n=1 Tax=Limosa lapponica baueri TaxID=1758121 RepID=A0A2I0U7M8_LIMLA|nr:suppression of tumorigenicity 5 protein isoform x4 [Limosa lapponica baueri]